MREVRLNNGAVDRQAQNIHHSRSDNTVKANSKCAHVRITFSLFLSCSKLSALKKVDFPQLIKEFRTLFERKIDKCQWYFCRS